MNHASPVHKITNKIYTYVFKKSYFIFPMGYSGNNPRGGAASNQVLFVRPPQLQISSRTPLSAFYYLDSLVFVLIVASNKRKFEDLSLVQTKNRAKKMGWRNFWSKTESYRQVRRAPSSGLYNNARGFVIHTFQHGRAVYAEIGLISKLYLLILINNM